MCTVKKLSALVLALLLALSCTACGGTAIKDTNGADNMALNTITDENILNMDLPSGGNGIRTTGLLSKKVELYGDEFSGVVELLYTNIIAGSFYLDLMDFEVTGGNFRMVVVNEDKIVADVRPGADHIRVDDLSGYVSLRIAGESATYSLTLTQFDYNSFSHH